MVDIGDGCAVTFKVESHNHPSLRGAVPGRGDRGRRHRPRHPGHGRPPGRGDGRAAVRPGRRPGHPPGAARRGQPASRSTATAWACPTSAASWSSTPATPGNPLVNALCVGVLRHGDLQGGRGRRARQPGHPARLADRPDGIGGASVLASATFGERGRLGQAAQRPGRRPVPGEAADRVLPGAVPRGPDHRHPGPGCGRRGLRHHRAGRGRHRRHAGRAGRGAAARHDRWGRPRS